jgi:hypothetical protein
MEKKKKTVVLIAEEIIDNDLKAIYLINEAISISTPRMVRENLKFVVENKRLSKKYRIKIV